MKSRVTFFGHSVHRFVVKIPIACLGLSPLFDLVALVGGNPRWYEFSFLLLGTGLVGVLVAMVFGLADWTAIPEESPARLRGAWHGMGMACAASLFSAAWALRFDFPLDPPAAALVCGGAGLFVLLLAGFQGAEMVSKYGMGIEVAPLSDATASPLDPVPDFEPGPPLDTASSPMDRPPLTDSSAVDRGRYTVVRHPDDDPRRERYH